MKQYEKKRILYRIGMITMLINRLAIIIIHLSYILFNSQKLNSKKSNLIYLNSFNMKFLKFLKQLIKSNDFFYSTQMLRYQDELQYKTLTGGFISLGIIITICVGFANMIIDTFEMSTITTTVEVKKNSDPSYSKISTNPQDSMFMFGLQISGADLTNASQYFDLTFSYQQLSFGIHTKYTELLLQPCTKSHWRNYPKQQKGFDVSNMPKWLCPPMNMSLQLFGKFTSEQSTQYEIEVRACRNKTNSSKICHPPQKIAEFFKENKNFLYFTIYFTNPIINPSQKVYVQHYLDDLNYVVFGSAYGSENYLYFTDYTIVSDDSIWPFRHFIEQKGTIVQQPSMNHPFESTIEDSLIKFYFAKSPDSIIYNREVQKLSTVFSFLGGTIGAFSAVFFILKLYTNFSFEIAIAFSIFQRESQKNKDQSGQKQVQKLRINFFDFFKFYIYKICNFFNNRMEWPKAQYIGRCQKEILKQLDIKTLLKRIIFLQYCMTYTFEEYQLEALQIKRPRTVEEIQQVRQKCISVINNEQVCISEIGKKQQQPQKKTEQDNKQSQCSSIKSIKQKQKQVPYQYDINKEIYQLQSNLECIKPSPELNHQEKTQTMEKLRKEQKRISNHQGNQIQNIYKIEEKMENALKLLKKKAKGGERISARILQKIEFQKSPNLQIIKFQDKL